MRFGSLFSGIGGIDLGLERAGFECAWQVECSEFCLSVLERNFPDVPRFRDVRAVTPGELEDHGGVDLIAGGFPCQDVSVAGLGRGLDGDRSGLWSEFARLVRGVRPTWCLVENVPGLRAQGADRVLHDLDEAGYTAWPLVVGARHAGAPHRRDRVWIVAHTSRELAHRVGAGLEGRDGSVEPDPRRADAPAERREPRRRGRDEGMAHPVGDGWRPARGDAAGLGGVDRAEPGRPSDRRPRFSSAFPGWPAPPGREQHPWEAPRTTLPEMGGPADGLPGIMAGRGREAALEALGNACVPQVVEAIGRAIRAAHEECLSV